MADIRMKCIICNNDMQNLFNINSYKLIHCPLCSHRMLDTTDLHLNIGDTYSDDYFFGGGAGYPDYLEEKDILVEHGRYYGELLGKYFDKPGVLLDVGAASGFILKGLTESGWQGEGIEPNARMAQYAQSELGLKVHASTLESFHTERRFDLVCFIQVIAHLPNPAKGVEISSSMLSKNGYILIESWNYRSWTARLFGKRWHEYSPPSVLHWFSKESLNRMMGQFGFELIASGRPKKWLNWKHARTIILFKLDKHPLSRAMKMLSSLVPEKARVPYPGEDLLWFLFKKKHQLD